MANLSFTVVSLFSGAGGMDMGFDHSGFKTIWANDIDLDSCKTHRTWSNAEVVCGDIEKVLNNGVPRADVVLGGFPCQGFSLAGPRIVDDQRNSLYRHFVRIVEQVRPYAFVAENVKGLLTLGGGSIFKAIKNEFQSKGYTLYYQLLNAADYGVPQDRFRVIIVGIRDDLGTSYQFPRPLNHRVTIHQAFEELGEPCLSDICQAPYSSRYMSRNRRRDWNEVSFTIPAMAKQTPLHPSSPKMKKLGPDNWEFGEGNTRRMSWRECAAVQSFPSDMEFAGELDSKYRQIGNAVPVRLAQAIANELYISLAAT